MSNSGNYIKNEAIREVASASITTSYAALGTPLEHRAYVITIHNMTNGDVYLTKDLSRNEKRFPAMSARILDYKTDDAVEGYGVQYYLKWVAAPGAPAGDFWVEVEYV
jgi:hypothetical protein